MSVHGVEGYNRSSRILPGIEGMSRAACLADCSRFTSLNSDAARAIRYQEVVQGD